MCCSKYLTAQNWRILHTRRFPFALQLFGLGLGAACFQSAVTGLLFAACSCCCCCFIGGDSCFSSLSHRLEGVFLSAVAKGRLVGFSIYSGLCLCVPCNIVKCIELFWEQTERNPVHELATAQ